MLCKSRWKRASLPQPASGIKGKTQTSPKTTNGRAGRWGRLLALPELQCRSQCQVFVGTTAKEDTERGAGQHHVCAGKEEEERHLLENPVSSWGTAEAHRLGNGGFSPLLLKAGGRQGRAGCGLALLLEGALGICAGIRRTAFWSTVCQVPHLTGSVRVFPHFPDGTGAIQGHAYSDVAARLCVGTASALSQNVDFPLPYRSLLVSLSVASISSVCFYSQSTSGGGCSLEVNCSQQLHFTVLWLALISSCNYQKCECNAACPSEFHRK